MNLGIGLGIGQPVAAVGDTTPGGTNNVILLSGSTTSGILKAGGSGYIKKAG